MLKFVKRHRRAIAVGSVAGVVVAGAIRVHAIMRHANDMLSEAERRVEGQRRRQQHLERLGHESHEALLTFLTALEKELKAATDDIPALYKEIKQIRQTMAANRGEPDEAAAERERCLWEKLKVASFTTLLVSFYSFNLLHLVLKLQIHMLGRQNFASKSSSAPEVTGTEILSMEARGEFFSMTYNFMLGQGLRELVAHVTPQVAHVLREHTVRSRLDAGSLTSVLRQIRSRVEGDSPNASASPLLRFVICQQTAATDVRVQGMLDETWDTVESPAFLAALGDALDKSLEVLSAQLKATLFTEPLDTAVSSSSAATPPMKPLVNLLAHLKPHRTVLHVDNGRVVHADAVTSIPSVSTFATAVFDQVD
mmetsp:Transcript_14928/g.34460  ORF Transcript_14928/g.34460 Transcript_14928/m.34460 type:complete len:367 (-) Transcript_14928:52-1152(-)